MAVGLSSFSGERYNPSVVEGEVGVGPLPGERFQVLKAEEETILLLTKKGG